jgi:hypothetical protein
MAEIVLRKADCDEDIAAVRTLLRAYGEHLGNSPAGAANICLQGYAQELERLPEPYFALLLAEVDGALLGVSLCER